MTKPFKKNSRYMVGLDSLRGLAILGVILYHINFNWMPGGFLGVTVFFVLSGYLITDILAMDWKRNKRIDLKKFWLSRARRLLPGMLVMLVITLAWITIFHSSLLEKMRGDSLAALFYVSNWWYIYHKLSYFDNFNQISPLNHFWSLAVEEQFYVVWPFIISLGLYYIKKQSRMILLICLGAFASALAMAILYEPGVDPSRIYYGTDTRAFSLLIGAVLALVWPSNRLANKIIPKARFILDVVGGIALIIILVMFWKTNQYDPFLYKGGMVLLSIATALLVANLAHPASRIAQFLRFRPLRWVGVRSYGIYLWHYPILTLTTPKVNAGDFSIIRAILQFLLIILIAQISWKFIEKPIRQGALRNIQFKNLRLQNVTLGVKLALVCSLFFTSIAVLGLSNASKAKGNYQQDKVEAVQTQPAPHPVAVWEKPNQETPLNQGESKEVNSAHPKNPLTVTAIGDSVMIDITPYLKNTFPDIRIDAQIGRQLSKAIPVVERLKNEGNLGNYVIIGLGTNGAFTTEQLVSLIKLIGNERKIIFINTRVPRPWESIVNERLKVTVTKYPNVTLVDWYAASAGKKDYFAPDGVHLTNVGAEAYAVLVAKAVNQ
ncbi:MULTISPECIES: acyltransferase family protein [Bacillus]|uniref:acyltransferase family protein n=1 Tax=Bacillus TaxID=1386 RepID=UPI001F5AECF2|nr:MULTISPECIES: acyltransferase family protein [unclassified Bacillus cereus group]MDA1532816.1 acyltransferase family protein [Bacillus cereus group sp. TH254-2LC]MDA1544046.1 acyltransferase family protein [Bacillus cereus group sp. TH253LC]MDA1577153.1 acyltransferase family protein [Bacillus cereus group sp. TH228LC]MDA1630150.1 acyltransferase family protein [Bacillus cereus group sp. TH172LC]MDA1830688.1 acyltransferase family protein [Bacillus cereus group sp. BY142LC]